jgi:hypothetical protein
MPCLGVLALALGAGAGEGESGLASSSLVDLPTGSGEWTLASASAAGIRDTRLGAAGAEGKSAGHSCHPCSHPPLPAPAAGLATLAAGLATLSDHLPALHQLLSFWPPDRSKPVYPDPFLSRKSWYLHEEIVTAAGTAEAAGPDAAGSELGSAQEPASHSSSSQSHPA